MASFVAPIQHLGQALCHSNKMIDTIKNFNKGSNLSLKAFINDIVKSPRQKLRNLQI